MKKPEALAPGFPKKQNKPSYFTITTFAVWLSVALCKVTK